MRTVEHVVRGSPLSLAHTVNVMALPKLCRPMGMTTLRVRRAFQTATNDSIAVSNVVSGSS